MNVSEPLGTPYWWTADTSEAAHGVQWVETCSEPLHDVVDVLVIGAGYTGLSAAMAAHDDGASVQVIDAGDPGKGASTRNGGMCGAHPRIPYEQVARQFGESVARGVYNEANQAFAFVEQLIARESIDCDFNPCGRIQFAWTRAHFATQQKLVEKLTSLSDINMQLLSREQLVGEVGTEKYFGGILFPEHASLHPRKFHQGMLAAVCGRGVPVHAQCAATGWHRDGQFTIVHTPKGTIKARKLVLATNGYTTAAFRWWQRRVFPVASFLIATEALSANVLGTLAPGKRMMVETRSAHSYFRLSPDGTRMIYGGRAALMATDAVTSAKRLYRNMLDVWPELEGTRISHSWTGNTGFAFTHMPQVGEHDGIVYAMGYSGSGVAMAPYLGMKAGLLAVGNARGVTAYQDTHLKPHTVHPGGTPHFLRLVQLWHHHVLDARDRWDERRDRQASKSRVQR